MLEFSKTEQRKARRNHTCYLCGKPILRGCEYICETQKYCGEINTFKRHIHCDALLEAMMFGPLKGECEYSEDEVTEELRDICAVLHNYGECSDEDFERCEDLDCYGCYLVQRAAIKNPVRLRAAEQSVRDNTRREDIN